MLDMCIVLVSFSLDISLRYVRAFLVKFPQVPLLTRRMHSTNSIFASERAVLTVLQVWRFARILNGWYLSGVCVCLVV